MQRPASSKRPVQRPAGRSLLARQGSGPPSQLPGPVHEASQTSTHGNVLTLEQTVSQTALLCCAKSEVRVYVGLLGQMADFSLKFVSASNTFQEPHTAPTSLLPSLQCIEQVTNRHSDDAPSKTPSLKLFELHTGKV